MARVRGTGYTRGVLAGSHPCCLEPSTPSTSALTFSNRAHALAALPEIVERVGTGTEILVNLSGRGDKDMETLAPLLEDA